MLVAAYLVLGVLCFTKEHGSCFNAQDPSSLVVDVCNAKYRGFLDDSLYSWLGIQYGEVTRFQRPSAPPSNSTTMDAYAQGTHCSQFQQTNGQDNASGIDPGVEQCLFLNVYVPKAVACTNASAPVVIWIHGGGYGYGYPDAFGNATNVLPADGGNTILVTIQYRLGIFGFLAGTEIHEHGNSNLGIYDQVFAAQWVHDNIANFGGNPDHVTIWGESAGGGSVMLMTQAFGGSLENSLWQGCIANSPYLPIQYNYDDPVPQAYYDSMVNLTGCAGPHNFTCISEASYDTLFYAGQNLTGSLSPYGTWSANPVTDGRILKAPPSQALYPAKVNGKYMYAGNTAHEGPGFTPPSIETEADVEKWFATEYPLIDAHTTELIFEVYPSPASSNGLYSTQFLRAAQIYGDATFLCPAYWLALAYPNGRGFKYTFDLGTALHGSDLSVFFDDAVAYNITSARAYVVSALTSFWETWDPTTAPEFEDLTWGAYIAKTNYSEINFMLTSSDQTDASTYAYTTATGLVEPSRCSFWRAIGPLVRE